MKARKHASQTAPTSDVMVVELKQHPLGLHMPKRKRTALIAGAIVIILAVGGYLIYNNRSQTVSVCTSTMTREGNIQNNLQNSNTFTLFVGKIKALQNYQRDPNCMYMIAEYQIAVADLPSAQSTISQLKSAYGANYVYDKNLDNGHASLANLQKEYSLTKRAIDNTKGTIVPAI